MNIEELLKKFYDGVSTPEEEQLLKVYFLNEENIDDRWEADQRLFKALYNEEIQIPEGISERLDKAIERMDKSSPASNNKRRYFSYWISGVAAVALLCIGLFFVTPQSAKPQMADTFEDPVEAAMAAEKAIAFMSSYMNKGLDQVSDAGQEIKKMNQVLDKLKTNGQLKVNN